MKWGVFTGVWLGALALAWQGYTYAVLIVGFTFLIAMIVERIRRVDSFGLYVTTWIIGLVAFPMMMPYYLVQGDLRTFFDLPILLLFGMLALMLPFLLMRDIPWVFSVPTLVGIVGAAVLFLRFVLPSYFADVVTGQGYFVKTLIYSTVAEAQAPSFDSLILGYGWSTFFLAFVGLALFVYLLVRHRFKRYHIALLVFGVVSLYLPITASKFFLLGTPAFALLSAETLHRALDVGGYPGTAPHGRVALRSRQPGRGVPSRVQGPTRARPRAGRRARPAERLDLDRRRDPREHEGRLREPDQQHDPGVAQAQLDRASRSTSAPRGRRSTLRTSTIARRTIGSLSKIPTFPSRPSRVRQLVGLRVPGDRPRPASQRRRQLPERDRPRGPVPALPERVAGDRACDHLAPGGAE